MLSCELIYLHVTFVVYVEFILLCKWLGLELAMEVCYCGKVVVLFIYSDWFLLLVAELISGHEVACVPWLQTWYSVERSEFSLVVDESNIDLFCSGHFTGFVSGRLRHGVGFLVPVAHENFGVVSVTDLFHVRSFKWKILNGIY